MGARDEFSPRTKQTLAERAAHFCSNPDCLKLTAGPHSDQEKSLRTGHAAHIRAAASNGPRYDENQTPEQRKHISNGLWLCRECGDIVDKDSSPHKPELLLQWKRDHEALIAEVRTKGYAQSLVLLQTRQQAPQLAKDIVSEFEDHRALWESFDAEFPDRVRQSLDRLRFRLLDLRKGLPQGGELDLVLQSLTKTILTFFVQVEEIDLVTLRCDSGNPSWLRFRDALATLRKSVGLQLFHLCDAYKTSPTDELAQIMPQTD
ncbi:hypothetical protein [Roseinatronobacter alkalisoli]|uniref:HNH endonuclease n=1 Tax=Roseinatronobacter alkalisoli TaxID=3028235 RepID=A0ABT5TCQ1_9RHOB|nr:hypothetical protein [Roseinatronobacter sp. HJB301]MDD7972879.1 hypothetical protein [Roseinatronobacter sp. HJB301]